LNSGGAFNWERLARTETHVLRLAILDVLSMDGGRSLAKMELSYELQEPLGKLDYHVRVLLKTRFIRLAHEHEVGGVVERFYCLSGPSPADLTERLRP
jgi:hypothetical protein